MTHQIPIYVVARGSRFDVLFGDVVSDSRGWLLRPALATIPEGMVLSRCFPGTGIPHVDTLVQDNERVSLLQFRCDSWWDEVEGFWNSASINVGEDTDQKVARQSETLHSRRDNNGPGARLCGEEFLNLGRQRHPDGPAIHFHWGSIVDCVDEVLRRREPVSQLAITRPYLHCENVRNDGTDNPWVMWRGNHFSASQDVKTCDLCNSLADGKSMSETSVVIPQALITLAGVDIQDRWVRVRARQVAEYESLNPPTSTPPLTGWRNFVSQLPEGFMEALAGFGSGSA